MISSTHNEIFTFSGYATGNFMTFWKVAFLFEPLNGVVAVWGTYVSECSQNPQPSPTIIS